MHIDDNPNSALTRCHHAPFERYNDVDGPIRIIFADYGVVSDERKSLKRQLCRAYKEPNLDKAIRLLKSIRDTHQWGASYPCDDAVTQIDGVLRVAERFKELGIDKGAEPKINKYSIER